MFKWREEFTCFNKEIDEQHSRLFELVSKLYEIISLKDNCDHYDEIVAIFGELSEYTVYHFGYEEQLFEKYNYDAAEAKLHKLEHNSFIKKVSEVDLKELDENQRGKSLEIVLFIARWVEEHILDTDKKFGEYLKGIKA
ncbi:MAG: bacteriohemerythrin [Clostridia bacterium]|nr:bacteriohemerythrin [Clostridia bacterium]